MLSKSTSELISPVDRASSKILAKPSSIVEFVPLPKRLPNAGKSWFIVFMSTSANISLVTDSKAFSSAPCFGWLLAPNKLPSWLIRFGSCLLKSLRSDPKSWLRLVSPFPVSPLLLLIIFAKSWPNEENSPLRSFGEAVDELLLLFNRPLRIDSPWFSNPPRSPNRFRLTP